MSGFDGTLADPMPVSRMSTGEKARLQMMHDYWFSQQSKVSFMANVVSP